MAVFSTPPKWRDFKTESNFTDRKVEKAREIGDFSVKNHENSCKKFGTIFWIEMLTRMNLSKHSSVAVEECLPEKK